MHRNIGPICKWTNHRSIRWRPLSPNPASDRRHSQNWEDFLLTSLKKLFLTCPACRRLGDALGRLSDWNAFKHDEQSNLDQAELHRAQAQREAAWSTLKAQAGPESPRYQVRMMMPCNGRDNYKQFGQWRDWSAFKHDEQRTLELVGRKRAQAQTYAAWSTLKAQKMQSEL